MSGIHPNNGFTPAMRDLQARGKDPYERNMHDPKRNYLGPRANVAYGQGGVAPPTHAGASSSEEPGHHQSKSGRDPEMYHTESFEQRERRQMAMSVLDSPDLLMLIAESEGDSVAAQRQRFTRMLCGFDDAAAASATSTPSPASEAGGSGSRRRSPPHRKSRTSTGGGSGGGSGPA